MSKKDIIDLIRLPTVRYQKDKILMDVKFEYDSLTAWAVCGNDWVNALRGLEFPISYYEIVRDGWKKE